MASEPQPLDQIPLIRRKRAEAEGDRPQEPDPVPARDVDDTGVVDMDQPSLKMKPRETIQLSAVHVRIPEQIARGLKLMSVLENIQAQTIVAEALDRHLTAWNPHWRQSVPAKS